MRAYLIAIMVAVAIVWHMASCTKTSYKSYTCYCTQEKNGDILDRREYGVQATDLSEANYFCNDIEDRINNPNQGEEIEPDFDCSVNR